MIFFDDFEDRTTERVLKMSPERTLVFLNWKLVFSVENFTRNTKL